MTNKPTAGEPNGEVKVLHEWSDGSFDYKIDARELWRRGNGCDWSPFDSTGFMGREILRLALALAQAEKERDEARKALIECDVWCDLCDEMKLRPDIYAFVSEQVYEMARRKVNREYSTALGAASGIDADKAERDRHAKLEREAEHWKREAIETHDEYERRLQDCEKRLREAQRALVELDELLELPTLLRALPDSAPKLLVLSAVALARTATEESNHG